MERTYIVGFKFVPQDFWIGVYWKDVFEPVEGAGTGLSYRKYFICLIPMLPFIIIKYK